MEEIIRKQFPDNYGRAWIALLESDLSEHARMCYVAMTSFGAESRAGKASIARRMGVKSLSTVKAAQAELIKAKWIVKTQEGGGKTPSVWDVMANPLTGAYYAPPQGVQRPTPGRITAPKQEDNQEKKQRAEAAVSWMLSYGQKWTAKTGEPMAREQGCIKLIQELQAQGVTKEAFDAKVDAYLAMDGDEYVARSRWSLLVLLKWRWNGLQARPAPNKGNGPELAI